MYKQLLPYIKKYKKYPILAFLTMMIEVVCEVTQPLVMLKIIDIGIPNKDSSLIIHQGLVMVLIACVSLTAGTMSARFASIGGTGIAAELRQAEMKKIQQLSFHNIDYFSNSSLITRMTSDITSVQNTAIMTMRLLARAPLLLIFALIFAIRLNMQLSLVFVIAIPILTLSLGLIIAIAFPRFHQLQQAVDRINRTLQENFVGIRVVKSFVREDYEREKFHQENENYKQRALHAMNVVVYNNPVMQLTIYACIIAVMWFGGNMVMTGSMTTGELIGFLSYITQILVSLMMISFIFIMLTITKASLERIFEVMNTEIDVKEPMNPKNHCAVSGSVRFEDVHFSYGKDPEAEVLSDLNFEVGVGEVFGIIGSTGSGKTSLVQLIPRLYDTTEGAVYVGGVNVRDFSFKDLRNNVAMVLQQNTLFSGTIRENLLWGNQFATDEELIQAAKNAQAHDFIMAMPEGYDTKLEQGGGNLSGGQKQRLCIARALVKDPAVLILDDSTSAVDAETDAKIREAFFTDLPNTTVIIIAQRISSIQGADKILVLEDGKMHGLGTHEELLESNELYREIYHTQTEGVEA
ncbi:ATP-binding cassette, subfamily B [Granulicatella balaenopterae]|uniref:ATP-binding cassette, subfamily B n=1 Tax=Granulicatella balaenopterae TaxID=137733 RepID=A0A1H9JTL8_9LACT|nr:ABC transporter ATP-binding protein [Granulicatella balaenopterae]SEQ90137.1 ATP-binding cassette, subfamily B [Granulicatella balaenopterae]